MAWRKPKGLRGKKCIYKGVMERKAQTEGKPREWEFMEANKRNCVRKKVVYTVKCLEIKPAES